MPLIAVLALTASLTACSSPGDEKSHRAPRSVVSGAGEKRRPNIVFILTDDLDARLYANYPVFRRELVEAGTSFSNYFVTDSLCCPSRSTTLRGQYIHNHHVTTNTPPEGGFETFHRNGDERSTMATWLHNAGYHTGLFGKYLNGYPHTASPDFIPPGWDEWASPSAGNAYAEYNYALNVNGQQVRHGSKPSDYLVDVLANQAVSFIRRNADRPYMAYVAPYVPHQPATPPPNHIGELPAGVKAPRTASFNEADVSDKPAWERNRPLLPQPAIEAIDSLYRRRRLTMLAIDDMVSRIVAALRSTGQLDNTYIVFSSDNGFHLGQHRLPAGKQTPYEEDIHVPLVIRGPGVAPGATVDDMALNTDLAPTFAAMGGANVPSFADGRSLLPLLGKNEPVTWRHSLLVEHVGSINAGNSARQRRARARGTPDTAPVDPDFDAAFATDPTHAVRNRRALLVAIPSYAAIRTDRHLYVEYVTGDKELYDLRFDPAELDNLAPITSPTVLRRFAYRLHQLTACQESSCRAAEDLPSPTTN